MTTYTARVPNSTVGSNAAFITGVNPTMHGSITDNVNNTFVEIPPYNASGPGYFDVGLPYTPLAEGQIPTQLVLKFKLGANPSGFVGFYGIKVSIQSSLGLVAASSIINTSRLDGTPPLVNYSVVFDLIKYPDIVGYLPNLVIHMEHAFANIAIPISANIYVGQLDVTIGYISAPTASLPTLVSPIKELNSNIYTYYRKLKYIWLYNDTDGDPQLGYQFILTTQGAGGSAAIDPFDPINTVLEDSGLVLSTDNSYTTKNDYRITAAVLIPVMAWVRVAQRAGTNIIWSPWVLNPNLGMSTAIESPKYVADINPPAISSSIDNANGVINLTFNNICNLLPQVGAAPSNLHPYWISDPTRACTVAGSVNGQLTFTRSSGTGDIAVLSHSATSVLNAWGYYPVLDSQVYKFQFDLSQNSGANRTYQFEVSWYDKNSNIIGSTVTSTGTVVSSGGTFATFSATFTAPSTARFAKLGMAILAMPVSTSGIAKLIYFGLNVTTPIIDGCFSNGLNKIYIDDADSGNSTAWSWQSRTNAIFSNTDVSLTSPLGGTYISIKSSAIGATSAVNLFGASLPKLTRVVPKNTYFFSCWISAINGANIVNNPTTGTPLIDFGIEWAATADGPTLSKISFGFNANGVLSRTVVPPDGAVYMRLFVKFTTTGSANAGVAIDQIFFALKDQVPYVADGIPINFSRGVQALWGNLQSCHTTAIVEKSISSTGPWAEIRGSGGIYSYFNQVKIADSEVAPSGSYYYRARSASTDSLRDVIGDYSAVVGPLTMSAIAAPNTNRWILKDPLDNTFVYLDILEDSFNIIEPEDQAMFNPLGRNRSVISRDVIRGLKFSFNLDFISVTEYNNFRALRQRQRTLLLQRSYTGDQWYINIDGEMPINEQNTNPIRRLVRITAVEVDVP